VPRNVEIKARVRDPARTAALARELATSAPVTLEQVDTFFAVPGGRLKLREFAGGGERQPAELIYYDRPDRPGPKTSRYALARADDPAGLRAVLGAALGERGCVRKRRVLLLTGRTRIHLDEVTGLGHFLELEVVLREGEAPAAGEAEARRLLAALAVADDDLVTGAYVDLLGAGEG